MSFSTPYVLALRTWLLGFVVPSAVKKAPPVPTTNWRMPARVVELARRVLRREALVVVRVAAEHDVGAGVVEVLQDRLHERGVAVVTGVEARVVPVRERARGRVRGEIGPQPLLLRRALAARHDGRSSRS